MHLLVNFSSDLTQLLSRGLLRDLQLLFSFYLRSNCLLGSKLCSLYLIQQISMLRLSLLKRLLCICLGRLQLLAALRQFRGHPA